MQISFPLETVITAGSLPAAFAKKLDARVFHLFLTLVYLAQKQWGEDGKRLWESDCVELKSLSELSAEMGRPKPDDRTRKQLERGLDTLSQMRIVLKTKAGGEPVKVTMSSLIMFTHVESMGSPVRRVRQAPLRRDLIAKKWGEPMDIILLKFAPGLRELGDPKVNNGWFFTMDASALRIPKNERADTWADALKIYAVLAANARSKNRSIKLKTLAGRANVTGSSRVRVIESYIEKLVAKLKRSRMGREPLLSDATVYTGAEGWKVLKFSLPLLQPGSKFPPFGFRGSTEAEADEPAEPPFGFRGSTEAAEPVDLGPMGPEMVLSEAKRHRTVNGGMLHEIIRDMHRVSEKDRAAALHLLAEELRVKDD